MCDPSSCVAGKECEIEVLSNQFVQSFAYLIVAHGKIIESKRIVPDRLLLTRFTFVPTFECVPEMTVIVYCVNAGSIIVTGFNIDLQRDFKNSIDLEVSSNEPGRGEEIRVVVKGNPNSFIGLSGIEESQYSDVWQQKKFTEN